MRFTIIREEFLKSLSTSSRAVNSKILAIPVLANLKLELNADGLFITGSNNDLTIKTSIPYSKDGKEVIRNYKEGAILINAKIITEIARKMEGEEITVDVIDSTLALISDNKSEFKINCVKAEEYPDLDLEENGVRISLTKEEFSTLVSQTAFAASTKDQRPLLTALNLKVSDSRLTAIATDSARLARKQILINGQDLSLAANIPARLITEVDHLTEGAHEVAINFSDKKALFVFDGIVVVTRLIAGDYPRTDGVFNKQVISKLRVSTSEFVKVVDRANVLSVDRENVVTIDMNEDGVEISSKSSQVGSVTERLEEFSYEGNNLQISFNSEYVIAAIRALNSEDVVFEFTGEMRPFYLKNPNDETVIQAVTPLNTY